MKNFILSAAIVLASLQGLAQSDQRIWNIKAILPTGLTLDVKAFDAAGNKYDVKAIENGDTHLMDVKALVDGQQLSIKVIASEDAFAPVKAIGADGKLWDIKALDKDGNKLDVKGVARSGRIIHIKALGPMREIYAIKAISPEGSMRDVKGIKTSDDDVEAELNGVKVAAHLKAIAHADDPHGDLIWNVKCVMPDGHILDVKALDKAGHMHDVKAFEENGDATLLDIKAMIDGHKVPVKILVSADKYAPVKAIGADGTIYDIKAITADGQRLDVKGVERAGNVIHIKALGTDGSMMGIKAISPHGLFRDVKGVKFMAGDQETTVSGVAVRAHVKAIGQVE